MANRLLASLISLACLTLFAPMMRAADNELTPEEKKDGYILLFNGTNLKGWHRNSSGYGGWKADQGTISVTGGAGMLYTDEQYDNFVLKIDFKMPKACNSGVFVRVGNPRDEVQTGLEIQILDDSGRRPSRNSCGAIYDLVAPSKNMTRAAGEWNSFIITANKNVIRVEMNGEKICEINVDEWDKPGKRPDGSGHKYRNAIKDFPRKGLIGLQDYAGGAIQFKNVKLKVLK